MERAVDYVDALITEHNIQSDYWFPGFLRVAHDAGSTSSASSTISSLLSRHGHQRDRVDRRAAAARARSTRPLFLGAWWEPRCGLLNPAKQVRELKRVAQQFGAQVYEHTPVMRSSAARG